jgi:hypothetical protein
VIALEGNLYLLRLELGLLKAEYIRIGTSKKFLKALIQTGAETVYIP